MRFDLNNQIIAITGGHGQLGQAFARALIDADARVAILDIATASGEALAPKLAEAEANNRIILINCDVTDRGSLEAALGRIEAAWEAPHGLVNNAAIDSPPSAPPEENGPFETYPKASLDRILDVNVSGVVQACQVFGGRMAELGRGSIINIGSIYGLVSPNQALYQHRRDRGEDFYKPVAYSVSKSALYNLTRYLATYWGARGVRVNTLTFGGVFNDQDEEFLREYTARVPLGRMAEPADYEGAIVFLLSDASRYMTGANLVIDGGWTAW